MGRHLAILLALALLVPVPAGALDVPVPRELAEQALRRALERQGDPYEWGGQRPGGFDCSGLILWAYEQALGGLRVPDGRGGYVDDATMDHLWRHATRPVRPDQVRPGDVVFITSEEGRVTHGGLVISVSETEITFVNASSYHGQVVVDTWPLVGTTRGQWVVGIGQLLLMPGRRPPMPPAAAGTRVVRVEVSRPSPKGSLQLTAAVAADGLQSEAALVRQGNRLAVGVGVRIWNDGWWGDQYLAGGAEPFALASAVLPAGRFQVRGTATLAESGFSPLLQVEWDAEVRNVKATVTAGYLRWAPDPWFSGPHIAVQLTFNLDPQAN